MVILSALHVSCNSSPGLIIPAQFLQLFFFFLEILNRFGFYHSSPPALRRINTIVEACRRSEYIFNRVMITGSLSLDRRKEQRRRLLFPD